MKASTQTQHVKCHIYREKLNFSRCICSNRKKKISQVASSEILAFLQASPCSIFEIVKTEWKTRYGLTTCANLGRKEASSQQTWE